MPTPRTAVEEHVTLTLRIEPEVRSLIDRAAKACGKLRDAFIVDAARQAAEESLDAALPSDATQAAKAFRERLDLAPQPNERLRQTMQAPAPWDKA